MLGNAELEEYASFQSSDRINFRIKNNGKRSCYYGVVGIYPNHEIQIIAPRPNDISGDLRLKPNQEINLFKSSRSINSKDGSVIFLLLTQDEPLSWLKYAFQEDNDKSRFKQNPFSYLNSIISNSESQIDLRSSSGMMDIGVSNLHYSIRN